MVSRNYQLRLHSSFLSLFYGLDYQGYETVSRGGIHQSFLDEKFEMISSLDFLKFTIHNHDSGKSTTQKHDPEIVTESCFCLAVILN
jgi:hypothetical protein